MKKIILILFTIALICGMTGFAEAGRVDSCFWVWSTAVTTQNDQPDYVYCNNTWNNTYTSKGATYIQSTTGALNVFVQYDSLYGDGSATVGALHGDITNATVMVDAAGTDWDFNVLGCFIGTCDTGTTTFAYWQTNDLTTNLKKSYEMTPLGGGFQITVDGDTGNAGPVIRTTVVWE